MIIPVPSLAPRSPSGSKIHRESIRDGLRDARFHIQGVPQLPDCSLDSTRLEAPRCGTAGGEAHHGIGRGLNPGVAENAHDGSSGTDERNHGTTVDGIHGALALGASQDATCCDGDRTEHERWMEEQLTRSPPPIHS